MKSEVRTGRRLEKEEGRKRERQRETWDWTWSFCDEGDI